MLRRALLSALIAASSCGRTELVGASEVPDGGAPAPCQRFAGLTARARILEGTARHARFGDAGLLVVTEPQREAFRFSLPELSPVQLASGVEDAEWLGPSGAVLLVRPAGALDVLEPAGERRLSESSCGHVATDDGKTLFVVSGCDVQGHGTLARLDVASGARTVLAEQVLNFSLVLHAGRLAFVTGGGADSRCFWGSSRCELRTLEGGLLSTSGLGCHHPVLTDGADLLALHQAVGCRDVTVQDVLIRRATGGPFQVLAPGVSPGSLTRWELDLSPDQRTLLARRGGQLLAVELADGATRVLATGVMEGELDGPLRRFTSSGDQVAFLAGTPLNASLHSVGRSGAGEQVLTRGLVTVEGAWPGTEEILFRQRSELWLADAASGRAAPLTAVRGEAQVLAVRPDGRGVVWMEAVPSRGVSVRHVSRADAGVVDLGGWDQSHLTSPVLDEEGCAVVFDSDRNGGGTWLAPLPR